MTITCLLNRGGIVIGSDRRADGIRIYDWRHKWLTIGEWRIGRCGPVRLEAIIAPLSVPEGKTIYELRNLIFATVKADGWKPSHDDGGPERYDFDLLIAKGGEAWMLSGTGCTMPVPDGEFAAVGSGQSFATGAFHVLGEMPLTGEDVVRRCIKAAIQYDSSCGGEPFVERLG